MNPTATTPAAETDDSPLSTFTRCHLGIVRQLEDTARLPEWVQAAARARAGAEATLALFRNSVVPHHREEEAELFTAVLQSALPQEKARVQSLVRQLTDEHEEIEALWKKLEPALRAAARGAPADLDGDALSELVHMYLAHARFEEAEFLPLAQAILGRNGNHMAALGLSLHMRHQPTPVAYI